MRNEIKLLAGVGCGIGLGFLMGSITLGLLVGTCFGLVWGYSGHMLNTPKHRGTHAKRAKRKTSKKRRK